MYGFDPRSVHATFLMAKYHRDRVFSQYFCSSNHYNFSSAPHLSSSTGCSYQKECCFVIWKTLDRENFHFFCCWSGNTDGTYYHNGGNILHKAKFWSEYTGSTKVLPPPPQGLWTVFTKRKCNICFLNVNLDANSEKAKRHCTAMLPKYLWCRHQCIYPLTSNSIKTVLFITHCNYLPVLLLIIFVF